MNIFLRKTVSFSIGLFFLASPAFSQPSTEWRTHSHDPAGSRYSPLEQIHHGNAAQLRRAWIYRTGDIAPGSQHYFECTPLMVEGTVYVMTPFSRLAAIDATTGQERWTFTPDPPLDIGETGGGGLASRGVSYWESGHKKRIFLPVRDGRLYSIDTATHKPDPAFGRNGFINLRQGLPEEGRFLFLSSPPALYQDRVIQGFGINDSASRYVDVPLRAYDAHTGEVRWSFNTVPQGEEFGAETWTEESWRRRGGCNVWSLMSVDSDKGIVYLPTGAPNFDKFGGDRIGKNLFGNSLVALDAKTGERIWHRQLVHHDVWDYDLPALPNLVDLTVAGKKIPAVALVGKTGFVYLFNRLTGEPVFPLEERPVPQSDIVGEWAYQTQLFPSKPPAFARQFLGADGLQNFDPEINAELREELTKYRSTGIFTPPSLPGTVVYPGQLGGANWSGAAVSPDGMMYVNANELAYIVKLIPAPEEEMGYGARAVHFRDRNGLPAVAPPWGTLTRIDLNAGEIDWQKPLGEHPRVKNPSVQPTGTMNFGGATVTAGEIVLIASTMDECFRVFDAKSGTVLFQEKMEAAGYGAPITYLGKDGKQYIVICAGGGGKAETPPGDYVIAFALNEN